MRTPLRRGPAAALLALAFGLASCGGGETEDVQELLDRAFKRSIQSADLAIEAEISLDGAEGLDRPIRIQAEGPFRGNEGKIPSVDLELRLASGPGQAIETGFLSTGDRAFVKFQDVFYEQPRSEVARANRGIARNRGNGSSLSALGLEPRGWLSEGESEGDEDVAGVRTEHVSGTLDVREMVQDFNRLIRRSGGALGGATGAQPPEPLSEEQVEQITDVVDDPSFDVYVGKDDDIIRRVAGRLEFEVPEDSRESVGGLDGGTFEFSIEFSDVNGDQEIEAPANARPLSALTESLGGGALGGLGGGAQTPPATPEQPVPQPPTSTAPDAEAFERYAECLDQADSEDVEALQRCAELLR